MRSFRNDVIVYLKQKDFITFDEVESLPKTFKSDYFVCKEKMVLIEYEVSSKKVKHVIYKKGSVLEDFKDVMDKVKRRFSYLTLKLKR